MEVINSKGSFTSSSPASTDWECVAVCLHDNLPHWYFTRTRQDLVPTIHCDTADRGLFRPNIHLLCQQRPPPALAATLFPPSIPRVPAKYKQNQIIEVLQCKNTPERSPLLNVAAKTVEIKNIKDPQWTTHWHCHRHWHSNNLEKTLLKFYMDSQLFLLETIFKSEHQRNFIIVVYHEITVFIVFVPEN